MKKIILLVMGLTLAAKGADPQTATQNETQHYIGVIKTHIFKDYKGMFKPAKGILKHPFITPGNSAYNDQLWDWDSWLTDIALRQILLENGSAEDKQQAFKCEQGCILNFLDAVNNGYIPVVISPNNKNIMDTDGTNFVQWEYNMHNPSNWLGPIWVNANYFVFRGLVKYGYKDQARQLVEKTVKLIGMDYEKNGVLHEYYLPDNGEPVMNPGFQDWNLLVLNMIAWYEGKPYVSEF